VPFSVVTPPRSPQKISSRSGSNTTPASAPSSSQTATLTHHCGTPKRKFTVPSSGSTIHRSPSPACVSPPSSPRIASPGRRAASSSRIARSAA